MAINNLVGSNTFNDLLNTVNDTIDRLNQIDISTVAEGSGISIDQTTDGDASFSISLCSTSALNINTNNCLQVDFGGITEKQLVGANDLFLLDTTIGLRTVKAENILPFIIKGDHVFYSQAANSYVSFETDYLLLNSNNVLIKDKYLYLNYNVDTNDNFENNSSINSGLRIYSEDLGLINFVYDGTISAWTTNKNLGFTGTEGRFLVKNGTPVAEYTFGLLSTQTDNVIKIQHTQGLYWEIKTDPILNSLNFGMAESTDSIDGSIFKIYNLNNHSVFHVVDTLYVGNIQDSAQFKHTNDFTSYKIPISNVSGVLDYKWNNRFVTQNKLGTVNVGDIVRISLDTDSYVITRADATTEENSEAIGIVEKISSGKYYVVLNGQFDISSSYINLTEGEMYYLSQTPGQFSTTKPTTIVKPLFVATGTKTGILLNTSSSQSALYKNIYLVDEDVTVSPSAVNDTLALKAGTGIAITQNSSNEIEIYASGGAGTQDTFKQINGITATSPNDQIVFTGLNGITVQVGKTFSDTEVEISAPTGFGIFEFTTDNTDQEQFTITSYTGNDTLVFNAGTGIKFERDTNDVVTIMATGDAQPASRSVGNAELSLMTPNSVKIGNGSGVPTDIQIPDEGVVGRIRDGYNNLSDVIVLSPSVLREMIGAESTGLLQANQNAFAAIEVDHNSVVTLIESTQQSDTIRFKSGAGILLVGEEQTDGDKLVHISLDTSYLSSYVSGFNVINLPDNTFTSGDTGGSLNFAETNTILPNSSNTNNTNISFDIKNYSITNAHLADMPINSIKGNNDNTDGSIVDITIEPNNLFGRIGNGSIKSLSAQEARTVLGLSSNLYWKSASIISGSTTTNLNPVTGNETLRFLAGSNIQLSESDGKIVISANGGTQEYGLKSLRLNNGTADFPTALNIITPLVANSSAYRNISLTKVYDTTTNEYNLTMDLAGMPSNSVKVSSNTVAETITSFRPTNLSIGTNSVLGRFGGALTSVPMSMLSGFLNIKGYSTIYFETIQAQTSSSSTSVSTSSVSSSSTITSSSSSAGPSSSSSAGPSSLISDPTNGVTNAQLVNSSFKLVGANGLTITGTNLNGIYGIPTFTFTPKISKLEDDVNPTLYADLNLNGRGIKSNSSIYFVKNNNYILNLNPETSFNTTLNVQNKIDSVELSTNKFTYANQIAHIRLNPNNNSLSHVIITNGNLSSGSSQLNLITQNDINLTSTAVSSSTVKLYSSQNLLFNVASGRTFNYRFSTTPESDLVIAKQSFETLLYSSNHSNLVFGANLMGGYSSREIIFRGNVRFEEPYSIFGNMNINGSIKLNNDFTSTSTLSKKTITTMSGNTSFTIDSDVNESHVVYNVVVRDSANSNISKFFTIKRLGTSPTDIQIVVTPEMTSASGISNTNINGLAFSAIYTNGVYSLVMTNIPPSKSYIVSFVKVSFN